MLCLTVCHHYDTAADDCNFDDGEGDSDSQDESYDSNEEDNGKDGDIDDVSGVLKAEIKDSSKIMKLQELIEEEGGYDHLFPPVDGTAFYSLICKINHSCDPNVLVKYNSPEYAGVQGQLVALKDISPGEELVQSYIDQSLRKFVQSFFSRGQFDGRFNIELFM